MKCKNCDKEISFWKKISDGKCNSCLEKERKATETKGKAERKRLELKEIEKQKIKKAEEILDNYSLPKTLVAGDYIYEVNNKKVNMRFTLRGKIPYVYHKKDEKKKYIVDREELLRLIMKNNYDIKKIYDQIEEELEYRLEKDRLKEKERKRKIREKAELDFYGRIKSKRDNLSKEKKEDILKRFNNRCAVCDRDEGLHIHHKDNNPKNNSPENLIVLCSVCHKKVHMRA